MAEKDLKVDFIGIGATRCGTTWIYEMLKKHPDVCVSEPKETDFFKLDDNKDYESYFSHCDPSKIKGEFTPGYFDDPEVPERIKNAQPQAKLILSLRDPAERAISAYINCRKGEGDESLSQAADRALAKSGKNTGYYCDNLQRWLSLFPRENIHIIIFDDIKDDPAKVVRDLYRFLGVKDDLLPPGVGEAVNQAHGFRFPVLQKKIRSVYKGIKKNSFLLAVLKKMGVYGFFKMMTDLNKKDRQKGQGDSRAKEELKRAFAGDVKRLEKLIGKDLSSWK